MLNIFQIPNFTAKTWKRKGTIFVIRVLFKDFEKKTFAVGPEVDIITNPIYLLMA